MLNVIPHRWRIGKSKEKIIPWGIINAEKYNVLELWV